MNRREVLVFREPTPDGYRQLNTPPVNAAIAPLAFPDIRIPITQLFLQQMG
ncbi:hypothetical protein HNI00_01020 [Thermoleptolyngbya oregonensis NK1-22]|uniref:Uncharacterized protein n=1 Tax=Thermoleptolyngbya oregonensis NK1-22 TaxID=2547457 RepID=A0AA96Y0S9_9CYAN|nr:hypothetical protein HNI00_01020 [Thermoleptolyngbya oregonensis NK1-22]